MSDDDCPCGRGAAYADCCEPYHRGAEPEDAETLMRARFCAFSKGEVGFLVRTLHKDHDDAARPADEVEAHLREGLAALNYQELSILDTRPVDDEGVAQVLFLAKVWCHGKDLSFVELSSFVHDGTGWRYLLGAPLLVSRLSGDAGRLRITSFPDAAQGQKGQS
ncbi:MAG: hypothetical protein DRJ42_02400 [Deltaproteobacteria bacterium]|nr:MAG: hypothetical protein DRJ42_02400 [Deltaproteobacteria bacterium]